MTSPRHFFSGCRCGHCKNLAPEWAKAAKALKAKNSPMTLAKLDATVAKEAAEKFKVQGFPTIKMFRGGKDSEYQGGRTEAEIISWVDKKSGPAFHVLNSEEDLMSFQEKYEAFTLGLYKDTTSAHAEALKKLASDLEDDVVAITSSDAIMKKLAVTKDTVVVLKTFDEKRNDLAADGAFDELAVKEFIVKSSTPLIQEFSQEAAKKIFKSPIQKHALVFTKKDAPYHAGVMDAIRPVAEAYKGEILAVTVPDTEARVLEFFGITADKLPTVYLADMSNPSGMKKYPFDGAKIETEPLKKFVADVLSGAVKPHLKSEDVAPEDTANPVVVLKGQSFADIVLNNDKDVFVEFYAPWCGHCKNLAPIWDQLGDKYKKHDQVVIAKMDSTANEIDVENVAVKGFPTLYFFKGNDKKNPLRYEGARELKDLLEYVKKEATNSVNHDEL